MNITLNINDTTCTNCFKNVINNTKNFTSSNQSFELQENYFLNVISVSDNRFLIIIQNGNCVILRNIIKDTETSLLIPSSCLTHILTITGTTN